MNDAALMEAYAELRALLARPDVPEGVYEGVYAACLRLGDIQIHGQNLLSIFLVESQYWIAQSITTTGRWSRSISTIHWTDKWGDKE